MSQGKLLMAFKINHGKREERGHEAGRQYVQRSWVGKKVGIGGSSTEGRLESQAGLPTPC